MSRLSFEWDPRKDASNQKKHSVSFREARTVFTDEYARLIADPDHSDEEDRFVILGASIDSRLLVVCHCVRSGETIRTNGNGKFMKSTDMRDHYDFSKSVKNPYARKLKKQVTIRLDEDTIEYFKKLAEEKDLPYQSLINLYLRDCAQSHKDLTIEWQ